MNKITLTVLLILAISLVQGVYAAPMFNISGIKINNATGGGIPDWNITLSNATMQTSMLTGSDGSYTFANLVNGTYNVTEETRSGFTNVTPTTIQISIAGSDVLAVDFKNAPIILQPTFNISGFKINNATDRGIPNWNITLSNATMQTSTLTGSDGSYTFANLVNGTYNVTEETRSGFTNVTPTTVQVEIAGSNAVNINFTNTPIIPPPHKKAKVTFVVTDNATGKPIKGAVVSLIGLDIKANIGHSVIHLHRLKIKTNEKGIALFPNVPPGDYKYRVSKDDYRTASGSISVSGNMEVLVKLVPEGE